jgi:hypothetical protein
MKLHFIEMHNIENLVILPPLSLFVCTVCKNEVYITITRQIRKYYMWK